MGDVKPFMDGERVRKEMTTGDLIEFDCGDFPHWGICMGNDLVLHLMGSTSASFASFFGTLIPTFSSDTLPDPKTDRATAKSEHIMCVAKSCKARIDNKEARAKEKGLTARSPDKIAAECKTLIGKTIEYSLMSANCEHFVTKIKYGEGWSDQEDRYTTEDVKPFMDDELVRKEMTTGDLIEFNRGVYHHWGICMGDDKVLHITGPTIVFFTSLIGTTSPTCSIDALLVPKTDKATAKCADIKDVANGYKARIDNKEAQAREKGLTARSPDEITAECVTLIGKTSKYSLVSANCEHFVTKIKYGEAWSDQVKNTAVKGGFLAALGTLAMGVLAIF